MTPNKPYLVRAIYEWIVDNQMTPFLVVDAQIEGVVVPLQFVKNGEIVLNVAPQAVRDLMMANDCIGFSARFAGSPMNVIVPMRAVLGLFSRENGQGMGFADHDELDDLTNTEAFIEDKAPSLSVVKPSADTPDELPPTPPTMPPTTPSRGKSHLRVVK
jgi:stringent starvation protein B